MPGKQSESLSLTTSCAVTLALAIVFVLSLIIVLVEPAPAQTYSVIHVFTGEDGRWPTGTLTLDPEGYLYGTTNIGGDYNLGTVFKMTQTGSGWTLQTLYSFGAGGANDATNPMGRLARDASGALYGATHNGGVNGRGAIFKLAPSSHTPPSVTAAWVETRLFDFDSSEGGPWSGDLTLDTAGNLYGTTSGGDAGCGTVYKLTRSGGGWTKGTLYTFSCTGPVGLTPTSGVTLDARGRIYGSAGRGGTYDCGTVYQLSNAGSGWTAAALYSFRCWPDGSNPMAGVIFDDQGNLYGATSIGGPNQGGVVFELSPGDDGWTCNAIYALTYIGSQHYYPGPVSNFAFDRGGNLYGTAVGDPGWCPDCYGWGSVFEFTPSYQGWTYTLLHDFSDGQGGQSPEAGPVFDSNGNLYGAAVGSSDGLIFEITP